MPEWSIDDSRTTPTFILLFPDHKGQIVVKKAASWVWVGFFEPEHAMARGSGYQSPDAAKADARKWLQKLGILPA